MLNFRVEVAPRVSVLVAAWREAPYLLDCLTSVSEHVRDISYEVVVALNEPSDELEERLDAEQRGVVTVSTRVNLGFAGAMNLAAREARGEYIVLLNDDSEVRLGWLEALVEAADSSPGTGAVGSTILFPDGTVQEVGGVIWSDASATNVGRGLPSGSSRYGARRRVDYASGCSLLVRRATWEALGGLDEGYFPAYYEDVDLCFRIEELGQSVVVEPRSQVTHRLSASTGGSYRSFLLEHNRQRFATRWSTRLVRHDPPSPHDPMAIERAVARAAGERLRILVLVDGALIHTESAALLDRARVVASDLLGGADRELDVIGDPVGATVEDLTAAGSLSRGAALASRLIDHLVGTSALYAFVVVGAPALQYAAIARALGETLPRVPVMLDGACLRKEVFVLEEARPAEIVAAREASVVICTSEEMVETLGLQLEDLRRIDGLLLGSVSTKDVTKPEEPGAPATPARASSRRPVRRSSAAGHLADLDVVSLSPAERTALARQMQLDASYADHLEEQVLELLDELDEKVQHMQKVEAFARSVESAARELSAQVTTLASDIEAKNAYIREKESQLARLTDANSPRGEAMSKS